VGDAHLVLFLALIRLNTTHSSPQGVKCGRSRGGQHGTASGMVPYQLGRSLGLIFKPRREEQKRNTKRPQRNKTTTCRFSGEVAPNPGGPMVVCPAWGPLEGVISWLLRRPIRGKSAPPSRPLGTSRDHPNTTAMRHVKVSDPHPLADLYDSVYRLSDSRVVHAAESWIHMSPISNKCYLNVVLHDIASAPHGGVFVSRHQVRCLRPTILARRENGKPA
jgi:hypothetical protein